MFAVRRLRSSFPNSTAEHRTLRAKETLSPLSPKFTISSNSQLCHCAIVLLCQATLCSHSAQSHLQISHSSNFDSLPYKNSSNKFLLSAENINVSRHSTCPFANNRLLTFIVNIILVFIPQLKPSIDSVRPDQAAMALEFSDIGKWYKDEVGDDDGFDHQDFMAREYAGERALFDIKGKTERFSASIGASWYYAEETMTIEDREFISFISYFYPH